MDFFFKTQAYINGSWRDSANNGTFTVKNPATGETIAEVANCSAADAQDAITAADTAFKVWKNLLPKERAKLLKNWHALIVENTQGLAKLLTIEQGKPLAESLGEVGAGAATVEWSAEEARRYYGDTLPPFKANTKAFTTREPIGVMAAITPWNFPHSMITRKVAPALAAGCTVVLKPAEDTPLSALALAALAERAGLPNGVFNVLPTSNPKDVGAAITSDARVKKLSFTGSTEVGRTLMAQCAPTLKRLSLELGGNAPFIVFEDADIDAAIKGVIASKFRNAGQTCICANRIFVQKSIAARFVEGLKDEVNKLKLGNGLEDGVTTGPIINQDGLQKIRDLVADATAKGAKSVANNAALNLGGLFCEPIILTDVTRDMRMFSEEIFGPVASIYTFESESEVLEMANASVHGLAAYFYTRDIGRAMRVADALEYGMVGINEPLLTSEAAPFGGVKQSGFGREGGHGALDDFTAIKYSLFGGL